MGTIKNYQGLGHFLPCSCMRAGKKKKGDTLGRKVYVSIEAVGSNKV